MAEPSRRSVLIHGINFWPELIGVGRFTGELADDLAAHGHDVEVVTAIPHYPGWYVRRPYRSGRFYFEHKGRIKIVRLPLLLHSGGRGVWRVLMPLSFAILSAVVVLWRTLRFCPDTVLCVEPTLFCAPAALIAAKIVGARSVLHVQDLELDAAVSVGHLSEGRSMALARKLERWLLRRFDAVVTISNRMLQRLESKGIDHSCLHIVRNWVDLDTIKPASGPNRFRQELGLNDQDFVVLYAGNLGPKQGLEVLVEAARSIGQTDIHFVIAGAGSSRQHLMDASAGLPNLHWLPLQPEHRLAELLVLADLHAIPQMPGTPDLVLPSKLAGALASGRAVLVQAEPATELHDLLAEAAIVVPPGDVAALVEAVREAARCRPDTSKSYALAKLFARDRNLASFRAVLWPEVMQSAATLKSRRLPEKADFQN